MVEVIDLPEEPKMNMSSPPSGTPEPKILSPAYALESSVNAVNLSCRISPNSGFMKAKLDSKFIGSVNNHLCLLIKQGPQNWKQEDKSWELITLKARPLALHQTHQHQLPPSDIWDRMSRIRYLITDIRIRYLRQVVQRILPDELDFHLATLYSIISFTSLNSWALTAHPKTKRKIFILKYLAWLFPVWKLSLMNRSSPPNLTLLKISFVWY